MLFHCCFLKLAKLTRLFEINQVQVFALHHFQPNSTANDPGLPLSKISKVMEPNLSFEQLRFEKLQKLLSFDNIEKLCRAGY